MYQQISCSYDDCIERSSHKQILQQMLCSSKKREVLTCQKERVKQRPSKQTAEQVHNRVSKLTSDTSHAIYMQLPLTSTVT